MDHERVVWDADDNQLEQVAGSVSPSQQVARRGRHPAGPSRSRARRRGRCPRWRSRGAEPNRGSPHEISVIRKILKRHPGWGSTANRATHSRRNRPRGGLARAAARTPGERRGLRRGVPRSSRRAAGAVTRPDIGTKRRRGRCGTSLERAAPPSPVWTALGREQSSNGHGTRQLPVARRHSQVGHRWANSLLARSTRTTERTRLLPAEGWSLSVKAGLLGTQNVFEGNSSASMQDT